MEGPSSSYPKPTNGLSQEEVELEDLWSELQAIRKLYGLLHNIDAKISDGDCPNCLDEKSRVVLKKLLDGATHKALQSQAKIVCYAPEPALSSEKAKNREPNAPIDEEAGTLEKLQKYHSVAAQQDKKEPTMSSQNPKKGAVHHLSVAEPKIHRKPCPNVNKGNLTRLNSKALQSQAKMVCCTPQHPPPLEKAENSDPKSPTEEAASTPDKLQKRQDKAETTKPSVPIAEAQPKKEPERHLAVAEMKIHRKPHPNLNKSDVTRQNSQKSTTVSSKRLPPRRRHPHVRHRHQESFKCQKNNNNTSTETKPCQITSGDLLAIVPAEKRARVEPTGLLVPLTSANQTRIVGRIDRELSHSKCSGTKVRPSREPFNKNPSRMGSIRDRRTNSKAPSRLVSLKDRGTSSKTPSRTGSVKDRRTNNIASRDRQMQTEKPRRRPSRIPARMKSVAYSSSPSTSQTSSSNSSTSTSSRHNRQFIKKVGPPRWKNAGPPSQPKHENKKKPENNKDSRLKRIKNKLAVIFHHHHHHHHHIHDGGHVAPVQKQPHRSPWTYLKSIVHRTSGDAARVKVEENGQRGYLRALVEGLIRHVWGMRRRRREKKLKTKGKRRLHWWQRFRRRGGVRVANKKMPRLRLGFRRSHSKFNGRKKS